MKTSHPSPSHTVHISMERSWEGKCVTDASHLVSSWRRSDSPMTNVAEPPQHRSGSWTLVLWFCHMAMDLSNYAKWKVNVGEINTRVFCLLHASFIPSILNCTTVTVLTHLAVSFGWSGILGSQGQIPRTVASYSKYKITGYQKTALFVVFIYFASFRVIYNCQNGYCIREGHSSREREMFARHL